ncbi:MAG: methylmalonyl-CoA epimerase [Gaiellales bacterium]|nr:methylmalonyl-CoA epimerase [Gaiellales bacterium]
MKINRIDHICVAVKDLEAAQKAWEPVLGKSGPDETYVDDVARVRVARYMIGETGLELMEDTTGNGDTARFIEKKGEGIMLMGLNVDSARQSLDELKSAGYRLISDPTYGEVLPSALNCEYGFVHPRALNGVLLEIIDYKWEEAK